MSCDSSIADLTMMEDEDCREQILTHIKEVIKFIPPFLVSPRSVGNKGDSDNLRQNKRRHVSTLNNKMANQPG